MQAALCNVPATTETVWRVAPSMCSLLVTAVPLAFRGFALRALTTIRRERASDVVHLRELPPGIPSAVHLVSARIEHLALA